MGGLGGSSATINQAITAGATASGTARCVACSGRYGACSGRSPSFNAGMLGVWLVPIWGASELFDETSQIRHSTPQRQCTARATHAPCSALFDSRIPYREVFYGMLHLTFPGAIHCVCLEKRERALQRQRHDRAASHPPTTRPTTQQMTGRGEGTAILRNQSEGNKSGASYYKAADHWCLFQSSQEDSLATVALPEDPATKAAPGRRLGRRDPRRRARQAGPHAHRPRDVEGDDAHRGRDAAQGQVHHLRPQGEAIPEGHPQYVLFFFFFFSLLSMPLPRNCYHTRALRVLTENLPTELPKWTRVSQRLNPPGY